jgi:hypothetical protein
MRIAETLAILTIIAGSSATPAQAGPQAHARIRTSTSGTRHVVEMHVGRVDASNASAFADVLSLNLDKVIGLKIAIAPNKEGEKYSVSRDDRGYTIVGDDEFEAVFQGGQGRRGRDETIDGYFRVLNGGMHQGVLSYGLKPVPLSTLRRDPRLVIAQRPFK